MGSLRVGEAMGQLSPTYVCESDMQGTVREDYSENGDAWNSFPFEMAKSRAYRWGEDGMAGISYVLSE